MQFDHLVIDNEKGEMRNAVTGAILATKRRESVADLRARSLALRNSHFVQQMEEEWLKLLIGVCS